MDTYQAVYDAVRSRIPSMEMPDIESIVSRNTDISCAVSRIEDSMMSWINSPSVWYRPKIFMDGDKWCALYGKNLQDGVAGFGDSPMLAMIDFDKNWLNKSEVDR